MPIATTTPQARSCSRGAPGRSTPAPPPPTWRAPRTVADKVVRACAEGRVRTVQGGDIAIGFDSVCIHSDTPGALEILQALRQALADNGIRVAALPAVLQAA